MAFGIQEKIRFEISICKLKGLWAASDNSAYFAVDEKGEYLDAELKTLALGWSRCSDNLALSSVVDGRYNFLKDHLLSMISQKELSTDLALEINKFFIYRDKYIDDMDYISDAYSALFDLEELFTKALEEIRKRKTVA